MCPADDSHLTIEFEKYFVIKPTITFFDKDFDYSESVTRENGKPVRQGYEYHSGNNDDFLSIEKMRELYNF